MNAAFLLIAALALTPIVCAEDLTADAQRIQEKAFRRELVQATDIAIVSRLPTGAYRVVSNLKGEQFAVSDASSWRTAISLEGRIQDVLRKESQLLVWQGADRPSVTETERRSRLLGAASVSAGGDVTLASGVKVNLIGVALNPVLIPVFGEGEAVRGKRR